MIKPATQIAATRDLTFLLFLFSLFALCTFKQPYTDRDYSIYESYYNSATNNENNETQGLLLFNQISKIGSGTGIGITIVFLFYAGISIILKGYVFRKSTDHPFFSLLLYSLTFFALHEYTQIRAALSISIFFVFAYHSFKRAEPKIYYAGVLAASFIHPASAIFLICPIMMKLFRRKSIAIFSIILSFFIGQLIGGSNSLGAANFLAQNLNFYKIGIYAELLKSGQHDQINTLNLVYLGTLILSLTLLLKDKKPTDYKLSQFEYLCITNLFTGLCLFYLLSFFPVLAFRLSEALMSGMAIALVGVTRRFKQKSVAAIIALIFCSAIFYVNIFHNKLITF